jgi:hypothetical protein
MGNYNPYFSPYYWNYYPNYFSYWNPFPVFRYQRNVNVFINLNNSYNYTNTRRCEDSYYSYSSRRANGYETLNPNRSFSQRNGNISNRYELDRNRNIASTRGGSNKRNLSSSRSDSENTRNFNGNSRETIKLENTIRTGGTRTNNEHNSVVRSATKAESQVSNDSYPIRNTNSRTVENGRDLNTRKTTREIENVNIPSRNVDQNRNVNRNDRPIRELQSTRNSNDNGTSTRGAGRESNSNQQRNESSRGIGKRG